MAQIEDALNRSSDRDDEGGEPTSRQIQADIDQTRSNMDRTFDAIESKLTPGQLLLEVWGIVKGGSGAGASKAWRIAREHPLPAAVIGLGVGWLLLDNSRRDEQSRGRHAGSYGYDDRYRYSRANRFGQGYVGDLDYPGTRDAGREDWMAAEDEGESRLGTAKEAVKSAAGSAADFASQAKEKVSDLAGQAGDRLGDLTDKVKEQASDLTGKVKEQASELGDRVQQGTRKARLGFWQLLEERPLVVGAATLAVGLLAGLSIPRTDVEDELMGEKRDQLLDSAKETGRELLDKGKTVASAAVGAAQHAAAENDLSVDKLADKVKAVANETREAVKNEAQKQNLTPEALVGKEGQQGQSAGGPGQPQGQPQNPPQNRPQQNPPAQPQGTQPQPAGRPAEAGKPQAQEVREPELAKR